MGILPYSIREPAAVRSNAGVDVVVHAGIGAGIDDGFYVRVNAAIQVIVDVEVDVGVHIEDMGGK